jgi:hypothetical protein
MKKMKMSKKPMASLEKSENMFKKARLKARSEMPKEKKVVKAMKMKKKMKKGC